MRRPRSSSLADAAPGPTGVVPVTPKVAAWLVAVGALAAAVGCAESPGNSGFFYSDTYPSARFGPTDGASGDGSSSDDVASATDAGSPDAGSPDAGSSDASSPDASRSDAGSSDAGTPDAGSSDAGSPDAGAPDTGIADASISDTGIPDTGIPDTGIPDAASPDAGGSGPVAATAGALVITEFHPDPAKVTDANGEWFEVYNPTGTAVHLEGLTISDKTSTHAVADGKLLVVAAKSYFVFAVKGEAAVNGGVQAGYVYKSVTLNNSGDLLRLKVGATVIDQITYSSGGDGWPTKVAGKAMQLHSAKLSASANDSGSAWCLATSPYGAGDLGTPGGPNATCPQ